MHHCACAIYLRQMFQIFRYRLDPAQPRRNHRGIFFLLTNADLRAKTQVAHVIHQCLGECKTLVFVVPFNLDSLR